MNVTAPSHSGLGLSSSQAATYLGVSLSTVRRWADSGYLKCSRTPGGQRRFSQDRLDAFLTSLERTPGAGEQRHVPWH